MIITVFSEDEFAKRSIIALSLAAYCAQSQRRVLLADATSLQYALGWNTRRRAVGGKQKVTVRGSADLESDLENPASYYRVHYPETVVDADGSDARSTNAALVVTDVLVIPIHSRQDCNRQALIERIEAARLFNPALRILVVEVQSISAFGATANTETSPAETLAKEILTATLADTVIHEWIDDRRIFDRGLSVFEANPRNERAVAEIRNLHQEIAQARSQPVEQTANSLAILHALQRRTQEKELCHVGIDVLQQQPGRLDSAG
ncbi:hypothetical protein CFter6_0306 [Collimonas fungivorans]|uniref:Cellulose biosynthesis protein BcsQ n=1 Tax=Collimonas fungivorans TaxID=158899 RepID=A0A127P5N4_9BURK|nr:hypothetical protein [Collimonas fungivorans]AMO93037.1 hypothetical protein CFter6_0306 [Collimonas fungivorans]